jgi:multidrug efflux pump
MALNVEFDFIRREITVGGLAGSWFVHLSAALVSGLFFSTALTLIMVPTMVTAPTVIWGQMKWAGHGVGSLFGWLASPFRRRKPAAGTAPEAAAPTAEIPADADSAKKYIKRDGNGLVETEKDGVTIVSRPEAAD